MLEGTFRPTHLLLIVGILLLVFGPKKLPELGKGIAFPLCNHAMSAQRFA
jgi:Sec-independent protein translocase protein TatA